jgi:hypothetical protein
MAGFPSEAKGNKKGAKSKRPELKHVPLNKKQIATLLRKGYGNVSYVADSLGCTRYAVKRVIDSDTELTQLLRDCRERQLDQLEDSVFERAINTHDTTLQLFLLKTQGKSRGYEQSEAQNAAKDIATAAFDFIVNKSKNPAEHSPQS